MEHERLDERPWLHLLGPLRELCLALPEASETINFGIPWFRAGKKPFAVFGADDGRPGIAFRAAPMAREQLLEDERFYPTPYMHHNGWLTCASKARWTGTKSKTSYSTATGSRPSSGW